MKTNWMRHLGALAVACCIAAPTHAAFDLKITEIWPGNEPGDNQTGDWFEVTNLGTMPWTSADGALYFDDDSFDPAVADPMLGIASIAPGESVVFVDDDLELPAVSVQIWRDLWAGPLAAASRAMPQVGYYAGSGLGGGGDAVGLFLDANGTLAASDLIDSQAYVDADSRGGRSWDVINQIYTEAAWGVTTAVNNEGNPSIGTPGFLGVVPEPTSLALIACSLAFAGVRRRG